MATTVSNSTSRPCSFALVWNTGLEACNEGGHSPKQPVESGIHISARALERTCASVFLILKAWFGRLIEALARPEPLISLAFGRHHPVVFCWSFCKRCWSTSGLIHCTYTTVKASVGQCRAARWKRLILPRAQDAKSRSSQPRTDDGKHVPPEDPQIWCPHDRMRWKGG